MWNNNDVELEELLNQMLTGFLLNLAQGTTIEDYLAGSDVVSSIRQSFSDMEDRITLLEVTVAEYESAEQEAPFDIERLRNLLRLSLQLVDDQSTATNTISQAEETEEQAEETEEQAEETEEQAAETEEQAAETEEQAAETGVTQEDNRQPVPLVTDPPVTDPITPTENREEIIQDFDDFDFDDEDLEEEDDSQTSQENLSITKHPEITEDFNNTEDSHMIMFIFSRYSHLPYHYILDGVTYKYALIGSQIVSTRV